MRRAVSVLAVSLLALPIVAQAASRFPDVPGDHPYNSPIEALAIEGVVKGDPSGNYFPARPVNRAEFLTLLYRATGMDAEVSSSVGCFVDVQAGAWFTGVVCDAAARGYVAGYGNGIFKPEQSVTRPEALKMIFKVFGLAVLTGSAANDASTQFTDVPADAWFTVYVSSAYKNGMLPIAGYAGTKFYPTWALLRGEAAAYIWNAMNISGQFETDASSSASSSTATSSVSSAASTASKTSTTQVTVPFDDRGDVGGVKTFVYAFALQAETSLQIDAKIGTSTEKGVTCRLYLLGENGLSEEYYLGYEEESSCHLRVSVPKGSYQLEVRPGDATASYEVIAKVAAGDNNDGFGDAVLLQPAKSTAGQLAVGDIADWFTFDVALRGMHTVQTFGSDLSCYIHPLNNVDLFGFTTPVCGEAYEYPKGTYVVRVQRADGVDALLNYSVQLD